MKKEEYDKLFQEAKKYVEVKNGGFENFDPNPTGVILIVLVELDKEINDLKKRLSVLESEHGPIA